MCEMCDMMMILGQFSASNMRFSYAIGNLAVENSDSTLEFRTSSTNTISSHFNVVATQNMTTGAFVLGHFPLNPYVWLQRKMKFSGNSLPVD